MALNASVDVIEERPDSYKAQITLSRNQQYGMRPVQLSCTLTKGKHNLGASFGSKLLDLDEDTKQLFEHLILYGAQKIVKTQVDVIKEQCGGLICVDTDIEDGFHVYVGRQVPGHIETEIKAVPTYLQMLTELMHS